MQGLGVPVNPEDGTIGNSSPPVVAVDTIVVGPAHGQGSRPRSRTNTPGFVQAYVPGSTGGTGWEHGAIDPETGYLYLGSATQPTLLRSARTRSTTSTT